MLGDKLLLRQGEQRTKTSLVCFCIAVYINKRAGTSMVVTGIITALVLFFLLFLCCNYKRVTLICNTVCCNGKMSRINSAIKKATVLNPMRGEVEFTDIAEKEEEDVGAILM